MREHVRVGVEARGDEVGDVRPAKAVAIRQLHGVAVVGRVALHPYGAQAVVGERGALRSQAVGVLLVAGQHRLAEHRGERTLDALAHQCGAGGLVLLHGHEVVVRDDLRERRWHLGQGQARVEREGRLPLRGEGEVHPMAEFMGQRHDVIHAVGVVHEHERAGVLGDRRAERTAALPGARLGIDSPVGEEALGDVADARGECAE